MKTIEEVETINDVRQYQSERDMYFVQAVERGFNNTSRLYGARLHEYVVHADDGVLFIMEVHVVQVQKNVASIYTVCYMGRDGYVHYMYDFAMDVYKKFAMLFQEFDTFEEAVDAIVDYKLNRYDPKKVFDKIGVILDNALKSLGET